jgi:hypothetical protein
VIVEHGPAGSSARKAEGRLGARRVGNHAGAGDPGPYTSVCMSVDRIEQSGLNRAWITASAALPLEWRIEGLTRHVRGPDQRSERWRAWAGGPQGETIEGQGEGPSGALNALARELLRGDR